MYVALLELRCQNLMNDAMIETRVHAFSVLGNMNSTRTARAALSNVILVCLFVCMCVCLSINV